jgi:(R)-citramalate synthase
VIVPFSNNLNSGSNEFIEIMDTTLRDGEQTQNVSFSAREKFVLAKKLLTDVKVDRIEITSARVSKGEQESCKQIFKWADSEGLLDRVEVLGFVDGKKSVDWIYEAGGKVINLLCKGSKNHCLRQLKKKPEQHFKEITETINYAHSKGFIVNVYPEDFSNGIKEDESYVFSLIKTLNKSGVLRVMLADTLGVFSPKETKHYVTKLVSKFPNIHFDFHAHNDYGLAVANSLMAVIAGCLGVHTTLNGLGERTGNTPLEQIVPVINDFSGKKTRVDEKKLVSISTLVEMFSKHRVAKNHPIVGSVVFTQTAGIHADGDKKGNLYKTKLSAKRFGRTTSYALGKLSGKSSIEMALRDYGLHLENELIEKLLKKVTELGDKKENVTKEDLLFLLDSISNGKVNGNSFRIIDYEIISKNSGKPKAKIVVYFDGKKYSASSLGDGGYDAFTKALKKIFKQKKISFPKLEDYDVRIPVGGHTDALVETRILWKRGNRRIETIGVSTDQVDAALKATEKMVNIILKVK